MKSTGVPEEVTFKSVRILSSSGGGTHCSGFTFAVAMRAAQKRGLLETVEPYEVARLQKEWYGVTKGSESKTLVTAMTNLRIGREIYPLDALPGDFVQFWTSSAGHSVIFLDWIKRDNKPIGLKYRSSQPATNGIGDRIGYFTTSGYSTGYLARVILRRSAQ